MNSRGALAILSVLLLDLSSAQAQMSGTITDQGTMQPIEGARVSLQASDIEATTDMNGDYSLPDAIGADLVIVAAAKGYFHSWSTASSPQTSLDFALELVPLEDDPAGVLPTPATCNICHQQQVDDWTDSPMAKAGTNTWVYDIYSGDGTAGGMGGFVYLRDSVHAGANAESECASCHQPVPWIADPFTALEPFGSLSAEAGHGVSCTVCHRVADIDISRPNFPGIFPGVVRMTRPINNAWVVLYGVLGDATRFVPNLMRPSLQPQLSSEVCAACHQDKNDPDGDGDFEEENGVISEPTYTEWAESPYADPESPLFASCADCHMPAITDPAACTELLDMLSRPMGDVRSHAILGTTPEYLENAVTLSLSAEVVGNTIAVDVDIENDLTGHHVPTGVTIRNMILLVEATANGAPLESLGSEVVHELGGVGDPAQGYYAGLPGKLYGKVNQAEDGTSPTFFTDATGIVFDNRIPALATDRTSYQFSAPMDGGQVSVRARLIYRRSWRALVDAKAWTEDGHGNALADVAAPHFGHLMEEAEQTVDVEPMITPDAGVDPGDGGGCGCRATRGAQSGLGSLALFGLALLALARRRRGSF